ncbi:myosin light chain 1-like [Tachypleus tridentatus]|uniref:myosin light chain 1-like n=1 Tax=Tachypleus tridentatus TaxID=6853 RepID=UPI003FD26B6F
MSCEMRTLVQHQKLVCEQCCEATMTDLKPVEIEKARDHFEIYDFEGQGKIDCKDLGDLLRSLDTRPTVATIAKNGGTKKKGERLTDPEVEEIMKCCIGTEDEDGFIKYEPFVKAVMAGPFPEEAK